MTMTHAKPFSTVMGRKITSLAVFLNVVPIWHLGLDMFLKVFGRFQVESAAVFTFSFVSILVVVVFLISFFFHRLWVTISVLLLCTLAAGNFAVRVVWLEPGGVTPSMVAFCTASLAGVLLAAVAVWRSCIAGRVK